MFTDPQVITINSVAHNLPRILVEGLKATYQKADETIKMVLGHTKSNKKVRTMVRTDYQLVITDPLTSIDAYDVFTVYTVLERTEKGVPLATVQQVVAGHQDWLDAAAIEKLMGLQS